MSMKKRGGLEMLSQPERTDIVRLSAIVIAIVNAPLSNRRWL